VFGAPLPPSPGFDQQTHSGPCLIVSIELLHFTLQHILQLPESRGRALAMVATLYCCKLSVDRHCTIILLLPAHCHMEWRSASCASRRTWVSTGVIGLLLLQKVGCRQLPLAVLQVGRCTLVGCSWQHDTLLLGVACVEPCQQFMIVFCHEAQPHLPLKVAVRWMELSVQLRF